MSDLVPEWTASAALVGAESGALDFAEVPATGIAAQVSPFFQGPPGPAGGAMTGGAGTIVVGSEIRLSIGTLPAVG